VSSQLGKFARTNENSSAGGFLLMNLIVSHLEILRTYVTREFYFITTELMSKYDWKHIEITKLWNGSGTIRENIIEEFGELPETILFSQAYEFMEAHETDIKHLNCHKVFLADDLHWWNQEMRQMKFISFALCDTVLATYAYTWPKFYPELAGRKNLVWIPHAASPDFMLPYNAYPENSVFLSGSISQHYPLRQQMMKLSTEGSYSIKNHRHPGYDVGYDYNSNPDIGRGYAEKINKYRVGFTDCNTFQYVVAKYFEIPATGSLLLAEGAVKEPLKELGFIENMHYVSVSKENLEDRVKYVLDKRNREELDQVRRRAQELVWERHTTSDRAKLIDEVCRTLDSGSF
jgi:hypothetical protein